MIHLYYGKFVQLHTWTLEPVNSKQIHSCSDNTVNNAIAIYAYHYAYI